MNCKDCRKNIVFLKGLCKACFDQIEQDIRDREKIAFPDAQALDDINEQMNRASTIYETRGIRITIGVD